MSLKAKQQTIMRATREFIKNYTNFAAVERYKIELESLKEWEKNKERYNALSTVIVQLCSDIDINDWSFQFDLETLLNSYNLSMGEIV